MRSLHNADIIIIVKPLVVCKRTGLCEYLDHFFIISGQKRLFDEMKDKIKIKESNKEIVSNRPSAYTLLLPLQLRLVRKASNN